MGLFESPLKGRRNALAPNQGPSALPRAGDTHSESQAVAAAQAPLEGDIGAVWDTPAARTVLVAVPEY